MAQPIVRRLRLRLRRLRLPMLSFRRRAGPALRLRLAALLLPWWLLPTHALGAEPVAVTPDASGLLRATLGLAVVLALIFAAGWVMRRIAPTRPGAGHGPLRIVGAQALGARERVVLVEVGEQWLVLGVAPGNVRGLATLPRGTWPAAPASSAGGFASLLARARGGRDLPAR
jgi:flagellar protein FliO/FliZ